jgi:hypothetical protein
LDQVADHNIGIEADHPAASEIARSMSSKETGLSARLNPRKCWEIEVIRYSRLRSSSSYLSFGAVF